MSTWTTECHESFPKHRSTNAVDNKINTMSEFCRLSDDQILFKTGLEFDEIEKTRRFFMGGVATCFFFVELIILYWVSYPKLT